MCFLTAVVCALILGVLYHLPLTIVANSAMLLCGQYLKVESMNIKQYQNFVDV